MELTDVMMPKAQTESTVLMGAVAQSQGGRKENTSTSYYLVSIVEELPELMIA